MHCDDQATLNCLAYAVILIRLLLLISTLLRFSLLLLGSHDDRWNADVPHSTLVK